MKRTIRRVGLVATGVFLTCGTLSATNIVSWVASTGSDANSCTRAQPCRTFFGAYTNTATGGAIHVVDTADYGHLDISKSITIDGEGTAAVVNGVGEQGAIRINSGLNDKINLRNLTIYPDPGSPTDQVTHVGILGQLYGTSVLNIDNITVITPSANGNGIEIELGVGAGSGAKPLGSIRNTRVVGGQNGIFVNGVSVTVERVAVSDAQSGLFLYSGNMTVRDSFFQANSQNGVIANLERSDMSFNGTGVMPAYGSVIRIGDCVIFGNTTGVGVGQGSIITFRTNMLAGNTTDGTLALGTSLK